MTIVMVQRRAPPFPGWPAEWRLSGRMQADGWHQSAMGAAAPMVGMDDLFRSEWPGRLRWQMLLQSAQLESVQSLMGWVCEEGQLPDEYEPPIAFISNRTGWYAEAEVSRWAFDAILKLADRAGWELVILEHPLHPGFIRQVSDGDLIAYEEGMRSAATAPHVHYIGLGRDSLPNSAFRDYHHLSCEGMEHVEGRLTPILEALLD